MAGPDLALATAHLRRGPRFRLDTTAVRATATSGRGGPFGRAVITIGIRLRCTAIVTTITLSPVVGTITDIVYRVDSVDGRRME